MSLSQVLNEHRSYLCKTINPARHFPYLRQEKVLSLDGQQLIQNEVTRQAKVNKLIEELESNGGPKAFLKFIESLLNDGTQGHVISKLNKALEEKMGRPTVEEGENSSIKCMLGAIIIYGKGESKNILWGDP